MRNGVKLQAHKGVEAEYPENTMPSFLAAVRQGYEMIELDLGVTKDGKIITMHDEAINSTARTQSGRKLCRKKNISDITYEEALRYDFGVGFSEEFRGTKLPLFEDVLKLAAENGTLLKIDNKIRKFSDENIEKLFEMIRTSGAKVCISCWNREIAQKVVEELPCAEISFDGMTNEEDLKYYSALAGRDRFSVWIPVDVDRASWAPREWFASPGQCAVIAKYAKLCIWAIRDLESFERAAAVLHPYAAETNGTIKPE